MIQFLVHDLVAPVWSMLRTTPLIAVPALAIAVGLAVSFRSEIH